MINTPDSCVHLTVDIVKEIHDAVLAEFGGLRGVHDEGLLHSAVAAPQTTLGGLSPFADLAEIGAAYLFYLCRNHPFADCSKRTAMAAAIVFLRLNGIEPVADNDKWESLMLGVSASRLDREGTTKRFSALLKAKRAKR